MYKYSRASLWLRHSPTMTRVNQILVTCLLALVSYAVCADDAAAADKNATERQLMTSLDERTWMQMVADVDSMKGDISIVSGAVSELKTEMAGLTESVNKVLQVYPGLPDVALPVEPLIPIKPPVYYPRVPKWHKCCKLQKAIDCCEEKVQDIRLTRLGNGLYHFYNDATNPKTWFEAQDYCRSHGMELVSIETAAENNQIKAWVQMLLMGQVDFYAFFWSSMNDLGNEGTFTWSGTGQTSTYFDWHASGQPDGGTSENCCEVWQAGTPGNTHWNERDCNKWKGRFICEMDSLCAQIMPY